MSQSLQFINMSSLFGNNKEFKNELYQERRQRISNVKDSRKRQVSPLAELTK